VVEEIEGLDLQAQLLLLRKRHVEVSRKLQLQRLVRWPVNHEGLRGVSPK